MNLTDTGNAQRKKAKPPRNFQKPKPKKAQTTLTNSGEQQTSFPFSTEAIEACNRNTCGGTMRNLLTFLRSSRAIRSRWAEKPSRWATRENLPIPSNLKTTSPSHQSPEKNSPPKKFPKLNLERFKERLNQAEKNKEWEKLYGSNSPSPQSNNA